MSLSLKCFVGELLTVGEFNEGIRFLEPHAKSQRR